MLPAECPPGSPSAGSVCSPGKVGREHMHPCYAVLHAQAQAPPSHVAASANWQDGRVAACAQQPRQARWNCTKGMRRGGGGGGIPPATHALPAAGPGAGDVSSPSHSHSLLTTGKGGQEAQAVEPYWVAPWVFRAEGPHYSSGGVGQVPRQIVCISPPAAGLDSW